jgi:hypothetical protein
MYFTCVLQGLSLHSVGKLVNIEITMGWTVRGSNPSVGEVVRTNTDWPGNHPASCPKGTGFLARGKAAGA